MAYVVRKAGSNLSETAVMDFIAKQVGVCLQMTAKCLFATDILKTEQAGQHFSLQ